MFMSQEYDLSPSIDNHLHRKGNVPETNAWIKFFGDNGRVNNYFFSTTSWIGLAWL